MPEAAFPESTAAEPAPEPTPETVAPTPESETAASEYVVATVTGSLVNLRVGPGTDHPTAGHVHAGDQVRITGRDADGSWLQLLHPVAVGKLVWIFGSLTDIDDTTVQTLAEVAAVAVELEVEAQPAVTVPTPEPVAQPEPEALSVAAPTVPADCVQRHTVNPNETRLQQITDWLGLDLAATAALNGIAPDAPLTAGTELCLPADIQDPEIPILSAVAPVSRPRPSAPAISTSARCGPMAPLTAGATTNLGRLRPRPGPSLPSVRAIGTLARCKPTGNRTLCRLSPTLDFQYSC